MITIIDYNSGNIASVCNALEKLGVEFKLSSNPDDVANAEKVIFPGVGRASYAMDQLKERGLFDAIKNCKAPFLGICLGLQLLAEFSEEDNTDCLSIIPGNVKKFGEGLRVPEMGWNRVFSSKPSPLFKGIDDGSYFYFVNSYYFDEDEFAVGKTSYGCDFVSVLQRDNFYATQFHPEKSGEVGLKLLSNFCELC